MYVSVGVSMHNNRIIIDLAENNKKTNIVIIVNGNAFFHISLYMNTTLIHTSIYINTGVSLKFEHCPS